MSDSAGFRMKISALVISIAAALKNARPMAAGEWVLAPKDPTRLGTV
jgi:hypothetical protein